MKQILVGAVLGVSLTSAVIGGWRLFSQESGNTPTNQGAIEVMLQRDDMQQARQNTPRRQAAQFDSAQISQVQTIGDVLKLPTDFSQTQALYTLAANAEPRKVIELLAQADDIVDDSDRAYALNILFSRLSDISPQLALEAANDARFVVDENIQSTIWRTWARNDFEAALAAVAEVSPQQRKSSAAMAMYWAVGVFGNPQADAIEQTTGIPPSSWYIAQAIEKIGKRSISDAVVEVNRLKSVSKQRYVAYYLALLAARTEPDSALSYAALFSSNSVRNYFRNTVKKTIAENNPESVLQAWALDGYTASSNQAGYAAFEQLALQDFAQAQAYAEQAPASASKTHMLKLLIRSLARDDQQAALQLADQYQQQGSKGLLDDLVNNLVRSSPADALVLLESNANIDGYSGHVARAIGGLTDMDPQRALIKVQSLGDEEVRLAANKQLVMVWARQDANAALRYVLRTQGLLQNPGGLSIDLSDVDVDLAMQYFDQASTKEHDGNIYSFVRSLVEQQSVNELINLLQRHRSNKKFDAIKTSAMHALSNSDPQQVIPLIDTFWQGRERSTAFLQLASTIANEDPRVAMGLLSRVTEAADQRQFIYRVLGSWSRRDAPAAKAWVLNMPAGNNRDDAINALADKLSSSSRQDMQLIESIENVRRRNDALLSLLIQEARDAPQESLRRAREFKLEKQSMEYLTRLVECQNVDYQNNDDRNRCTEFFYTGD